MRRYNIDKYKMLRDSKVNPDIKAGDTVYELIFNDYGLASDHSRFSGFECMSVTLSPDGDYPGFVVPLHDLERIDE